MFTCNVLCYGDSNTWGNIPNSFDPQSDLFQRYERKKRWTGALQAALGSSFHVIEAAINGRTTDLDEITPGRPFRNGLSLLPPYLESNYPIDIVIFMLGTNDAQIQYDRSAKDIAKGMRRLIKVVKESNKGRNGNAPSILLVAPQPILRISHLPEVFNENSIRCSEDLARYYKELAGEESCVFLDDSQITTSTDEDGFHLGEKESVLFGHAVAKIIKQMHFEARNCPHK